MVYVPDLEQTGSLSLVGYLALGHDYPKGEILEAVFDRLASLVRLHIILWCGQHCCDLGMCGKNLPQPKHYWRGMLIPRCCSTDIIVPAEAVVYQAPALILHYIRSHRYLPPACFLQSVLNCPEPGSDRYIATIDKVTPELKPFTLLFTERCK
jgi:hypothetical protein